MVGTRWVQQKLGTRLDPNFRSGAHRCSELVYPALQFFFSYHTNFARTYQALKAKKEIKKIFFYPQPFVPVRCRDNRSVMD